MATVTCWCGNEIRVPGVCTHTRSGSDRFPDDESYARMTAAYRGEASGLEDDGSPEHDD